MRHIHKPTVLCTVTFESKKKTPLEKQKLPARVWRRVTFQFLFSCSWTWKHLCEGGNYCSQKLQEQMLICYQDARPRWGPASSAKRMRLFLVSAKTMLWEVRAKQMGLFLWLWNWSPNFMPRVLAVRVRRSVKPLGFHFTLSHSHTPLHFLVSADPTSKMGMLSRWREILSLKCLVFHLLCSKATQRGVGEACCWARDLQMLPWEYCVNPVKCWIICNRKWAKGRNYAWSSSCLWSLNQRTHFDHAT